MSTTGFEARYSRWKLGLTALGSLVFVAGGAWLVGAFGPDHPDSMKATIAGWACIVFFGLCAVVVLSRLRDDRVIIRIDGRGVMSANWSDATIPWSEIVGVHEAAINRQKMIGLELRDPARFPATGLAGKLAGANRAMMGVDAIWLTVTGTDQSHKALRAAIGQHRG